MPFLSRHSTTVKNKDNKPFWECFFPTRDENATFIIVQLRLPHETDQQGEDFKVSMQSMDGKANETFQFTLKLNLVFNMINNILH